MFLPAALMISSFLRSTIFRYPSSSSSPMSPVWSQPSESIASAVCSGHVPVALHDHRAAQQHLAVLGDLQLHAGRDLADGAELDLARQVRGAAAGALGEAPQLGDRHADRVEELQHRQRGRRRSHIDRLKLVEAEHRSDARQDLLVCLLVLGGQFRRYFLARLLRSDSSGAQVDRPLQRPLALRVLFALDHRLHAGLQLLPDPGYREEPSRVHLRQVGDHLARLATRRHRVAQDHRQVVDPWTARRYAPSAGRRRRARPRGTSIDPRRAPRPRSMMLWCVICTPFGGPVVPDV